MPSALTIDPTSAIHCAAHAGTARRALLELRRKLDEAQAGPHERARFIALKLNISAFADLLDELAVTLAKACGRNGQ